MDTSRLSNIKRSNRFSKNYEDLPKKATKEMKRIHTFSIYQNLLVKIFSENHGRNVRNIY